MPILGNVISAPNSPKQTRVGGVLAVQPAASTPRGPVSRWRARRKAGRPGNGASWVTEARAETKRDSLCATAAAMTERKASEVERMLKKLSWTRGEEAKWRTRSKMGEEERATPSPRPQVEIEPGARSETFHAWR